MVGRGRLRGSWPERKVTSHDVHHLAIQFGGVGSREGVDLDRDVEPGLDVDDPATDLPFQVQERIGPGLDTEVQRLAGTARGIVDPGELHLGELAKCLPQTRGEGPIPFLLRREQTKQLTDQWVGIT
jgi:hypothetical protein